MDTFNKNEKPKRLEKAVREVLDCPVGQEGHYAHYGAPCCDKCFDGLEKALKS